MPFGLGDGLGLTVVSFEPSLKLSSNLTAVDLLIELKGIIKG